jgi:modulator of FtsH protease HflK
MAWNDSGGSSNTPGGNKNSDRGSGQNPWGKRPQQGPPDLDEVIRNFTKKIKGIFGGGSGNGGSNGSPSSSSGGSNTSGSLSAGVVLGVIGGIWLLTGFYQVQQAERAVILRFGKYLKTTQAGLKWRAPWPIDSKTLVNVEVIDSFTDQTRMLTEDENMVDINLAVQYRRTDAKQYVFSVRDPEGTLREVSESAIRETIGRSKLGQVLESGRQEIAANTKDLIQRTLNSYEVGIEVTSVNLQDVRVPEQVAPMQQDAIKASKDKERFVLEAQTYANDILPRARGEASKQVLDAQAYRAQRIGVSEGETSQFNKLLSEYDRAPAVTRQRLYLETLQEVMGNSKKVIVDTKGSNNMLYVPLDKLVEQSKHNSVPSSDSVVTTRVTAPATNESTDARRGSR